MAQAAPFSGTIGGRFILSAMVSNLRGGSGFLAYPATHMLLWSRYRVSHLQLGQWMSRDPLGYVDGPNTRYFMVGNGIVVLDPLGLCQTCHAVLPTFDNNMGSDSDNSSCFYLQAGLGPGDPQHMEPGKCCHGEAVDPCNYNIIVRAKIRNKSKTAPGYDPEKCPSVQTEAGRCAVWHASGSCDKEDVGPISVSGTGDGNTSDGDAASPTTQSSERMKFDIRAWVDCGASISFTITVPSASGGESVSNTVTLSCSSCPPERCQAPIPDSPTSTNDT